MSTPSNHPHDFPKTQNLPGADPDVAPQIRVVLTKLGGTVAVGLAQRGPSKAELASCDLPGDDGGVLAHADEERRFPLA